MEEQQQTPVPTQQEICTIRIMFPVETDEQAIEYKKKINSVLSDVPNVQVQFSLMTMPVK